MLTSCVLRYKPVLKLGTSSPVTSKAVATGTCHVFRHNLSLPLSLFDLMSPDSDRYRIRGLGEERGGANPDGGELHQLLLFVHHPEGQVGDSKYDRWEFYPVLMC